MSPARAPSKQPVGTSISVYGSVPVNTTNLSSYTLDGASPVTYASPNLTAPYTSKQLMYQSPTLADGTHLLTMKCLTSFGVTHQFPVAGQIYFDYLVYAPGALGTGGTGGSAASTVVPASTVAQTSPGAVPISASSASAIEPTQTALSGSGAAGRQGANLGVVLPAVLVPSVLAILALLGATVCLRRRRRQAKTDATNVIYRRFEGDSNGAQHIIRRNAELTSICLQALSRHLLGVRGLHHSATHLSTVPLHSIQMRQGGRAPGSKNRTRHPS